jgi:predicted metallo-beta-lactamase superfamily hydrolase
VDIKVLGTESLGVRGLCCAVEAGDRKIVIDPGVALGYRRHGLLPHPAQVSDDMRRRRESLGEIRGRSLPNAEGRADGPMAFSAPVPHGGQHGQPVTVMMTRIASGGTAFVHASDVQLLDAGTVSLILDWRPDIALVGGPPLYLPWLSSARRETAWRNALRLARHVETLILDHHLLRCEEGLSWLDRLSSETGHRVICAADFMGQPRRLLEARRRQLYEAIAVPEGWHDAYARGDADTSGYRDDVSPKAEG